MPVERRPAGPCGGRRKVGWPDAEHQPTNQPKARFAGRPSAQALPPDALPEWLGSAPVKLGPILGPMDELPWMSKSAFNPSAVVKDGRVHLLFRAEDSTGAGQWHGTSRIGLAVSEDGVHFQVRREPVLGPTEWYEENGGCEDPRVTAVQVPTAGGGTETLYVMTYTAYRFPVEDPSQAGARLALAFSRDLIHWEKQGLVFPDGYGPDRRQWSKSGAILPERVDGEYLMYFGDESMWLARSKDLVHWTPDPEPVLHPRSGYWDGIMVEPGPCPWRDDEGNIHLLYNGDAPPAGYAAGEVVFSAADPRKVLRRSNTPLLGVTESWERLGQVGDVLFLEGLAWLLGKVFFYYGAADGQVAVAVADDPAPQR